MRPGQPPRPILPANSLQPRAVQPAAPIRRPAPQPILPKNATTGAVQPHAGDAFALPANLTLKPRGSGQPLPEPIQKKMESFFNTSFADVRVHIGPEAPSIGALAFTHGTDLYFAPGQYNPQSSQGQQLLGHELTHVVQQRADGCATRWAQASPWSRTRRWKPRPSGWGTAPRQPLYLSRRSQLRRHPLSRPGMGPSRCRSRARFSRDKA